MQAYFDNLAQGDAVTTTSGAGDDFSAIATGLTADAAASPHQGVGAMGARRTITASSSQSMMVLPYLGGTVGKRVVCDLGWIPVPAAASVTGRQVLGTIDVHTSSPTSPGSQACQLIITSAMKFRLAPSTADYTGIDSPTITGGKSYRVMFAAKSSASASQGQAEMMILGQDGTVFHSASTPATVDCKTLELGRGRFGGLLTTGLSGWTDEVLCDPQLHQLDTGWPIPIARAEAVPQLVLSSAGWTVTGAADIAAALRDPSTANYAEGAGGAVELLLNPMAPAAARKLTLGQMWTTALPSVRTVELLEGATLRKTWTAGPTGSWASEDLILDPLAAATITDWSWLKLRLTA